MNYIKLNLPPTKEQIEQAQRFIEYTKLCALVDEVYSRREMDYLFMDLVTNKRAISHTSNEGKARREDKWCIIGGDKFNKDVEDAIVESIKNQM